MNDIKKQLEHEEPGLTQLLRESHVASPSPDFAARIKAEAAGTEQKHKIALWDLLGELLQDFLAPKWATTFASMLVLGLTVGWVERIGHATHAHIPLHELGVHFHEEGMFL